MLPDMCDCLHSYVEHVVLFLYVDVLRRRPGSPCIRKPSRAVHNDVDLLMSTRIGLISMSVADPKYPEFSSL